MRPTVRASAPYGGAEPDGRMDASAPWTGGTVTDPAVTLDPRRLPPCHRCGAPAIVETDGLGIAHVRWHHEAHCRVLSSRRDRVRLNAALAGAVRGAQGAQ